MGAAQSGLPWLLRTWREDVARLSPHDLDERGVVRATTLDTWESGHAAIGLDQIHALDASYGAGQALVDLALADGTPAGLPARTTWAHNRQGPSGPHWAWIRPHPGAGEVDALLTWGGCAVVCAERCDERGVVVTAPVSVPQPAVRVHLREPGWVDFGGGTVPAQLGIPVVAAVPDTRGARTERCPGGPAGLVAPRLVTRFTSDPAFAERVLRFFGERPDLVRAAFSAAARDDRVRDLAGAPGGAPVPPTTDQPFTGDRYRALRAARGLGPADAARLVTALLPDDPVTADQIGSLERGANPRAVFLRSRLDRAYRADGVTCVEEVRTASVHPPFVFQFPDHWIGPVWFRFESPDDAPALVELHWGTLHRRLRVAAGTTVACRRPTAEPIPFVVVCPRGWRVAAGMGARPEAHDMDFGWVRGDGPSDDAASDDPQRHDGPEVNAAFLDWFGRTVEEFTVFLRDVDVDVSSDTPTRRA